MRWFRLLVVHVLLAPLSLALGWGFVTHAWINRRALDKAKQWGSLPPEISNPKAERLFQTCGTLPDALSLHSLVESDHAYDAFHCLTPYGAGGGPDFGLQLLANARDADDKVAAYGWCAHQLSDGLAHYGGYCESLPTFGSILNTGSPGDLVAQQALLDFDHGLTEVFVDTIAVIKAAQELFPYADMDLTPSLVQSASRGMGGVPVLPAAEWGELLRHFRGVLAGEGALARSLRHLGPTVLGSIEAHYDQGGGQVGGQGFGFWTGQAVDAVAAFLLDPSATGTWVQSATAPRTPVASALPSGTSLGLPQRSGDLAYLVADALGSWLHIEDMLLPGTIGDAAVFHTAMAVISKWARNLTLQFCVANALLDSLAAGQTFGVALQRAIKALPPLVDTRGVKPAPGSTVTPSQASAVSVVVADAAGDLAGASGAGQLAIDSLKLMDHPIDITPSVTWDGGTWLVALPIRPELCPGSYEMEVQGTGPGGKRFRYEWEFVVKA